MGDILGGGGGKGGQGQDNMGVSPFDMAAIMGATGENQQAIGNRYSQLGLGAPGGQSGTWSGSGQFQPWNEMDLLSALTGLNMPGGFRSSTMGGGGGAGGMPSPGGGPTNAIQAAATGTNLTAGGPSTMERMDQAGNQLAGQAAIGQLQTANQGSAALNPALQPVNTTSLTQLANLQGQQDVGGGLQTGMTTPIKGVG